MKSSNLPPLHLLTATVFIVAVCFLFPSFYKIGYPYNLIGLLPLLLGIYLNMVTWLLFRKHKTPYKYRESTYVIQDGVFRFSRNPMYVGMILLLIGLVVLFQNLLGLIAPIFFFLIIHFLFIPYEEAKMEQELGDEYLNYKAKVRKWL